MSTLNDSEESTFNSDLSLETESSDKENTCTSNRSGDYISEDYDDISLSEGTILEELEILRDSIRRTEELIENIVRMLNRYNKKE